MFRRKSVDSILASFRKTVDQLNAHADAQFDEQERLLAQVSELKAKADRAYAEGIRAEVAAKKIESLIV